MTRQEHDMLVENNAMLKYIVRSIAEYRIGKDNENSEDFMRNIIGDRIMKR